MKKLRDNRGETLIEVLASILIATLSVTLLFGCITTSAKLDTDAKELDDAYYGGLAKADSQATPDPEAAAVPIETVEIKRIEGGVVKASAAPLVEIYGDNGVFSYKGK